MATILTDNFNSYNNGDLDGQGSWFGDTAFDVQGTVVKEGAKAVAVTAISSLSVLKQGSQIATGRITAYLRNNSTNGANAKSYFALQETINSVRVYTQIHGQNFDYYSGGWVTHESGLAYDTWHCVEIEWRDSDKKTRYRVNEGTWSSWVVSYSTFSSYLDYVQLNATPVSGTITCYFDHIAENPLVEHKTVHDVGSGADIVNVDTGETDKQVSDVGSGAEAWTIDRGLEKVSIGFAKLVDDIGVGADIASALSSISTDDIGVGVDSVDVSSETLVTDTGAGSEIITTPQMSILLQDTGNGVDSLDFLTTFLLQDAGAGTDRMKIPLHYATKYIKQNNSYNIKYL